MKWTKILECPYCGNELEEDYNACCQEAGHGEWVDVCAACNGFGRIAWSYPGPNEAIQSAYDNNCLKCKGTGGRK